MNVIKLIIFKAQLLSVTQTRNLAREPEVSRQEITWGGTTKIHYCYYRYTPTIKTKYYQVPTITICLLF